MRRQLASAPYSDQPAHSGCPVPFVSPKRPRPPIKVKSTRWPREVRPLGLSLGLEVPYACRRHSAAGGPRPPVTPSYPYTSMTHISPHLPRLVPNRSIGHPLSEIYKGAEDLGNPRPQLPKIGCLGWEGKWLSWRSLTYQPPPLPHHLDQKPLCTLSPRWGSAGLQARSRKKGAAVSGP